MALIGRVVGMTGTASLILGNGEKRDLKLGDSIQTGDTIQTPRGVEVDLQLANGRIIHISAEQLVAFTEDLASVFVPDGLDSSIDIATIDTVIKAIEEGKDINAVLEETAAGVAGQSNAYGFGFVDLVRVTNGDDLNAGFGFDATADGRAVNGVVTVVENVVVASTATNVPTEITGDLTQNLSETDAVLNTSGTLVLTDLDSTAATVVAQTAVAGTYGSFSINAAGVWSYSTSSAQNQLNAGQTVTEVFTIATTDGGSASVTITITGTNDAPVATYTSASSVDEDAAAIGGQLTSTDADTGASATYALVGAPIAGLVIDANGSWSFDPSDAAYQSLAAGATQPITVTYRVSDGTDSDTESFTITVTGTNDAPVATVDNATVTLSETASAGIIAGADADATDVDITTLTYSFSGAIPQNGSGQPLFSIDSGSGQISLTAAGAAFIDYESATKSYTLNVVAFDGISYSNTNNIVINLANENDNAPNIVDSSVALDENIDPGTLVYNVSDSFSGTDFDRDGAAITYSITGGNPDGIFVINSATGVIAIAAGKTLNFEVASTHNLIVTASDGSLSDTATITVNVNNLITEAFNDSGSVNENATLTVGSPGVLVNDFDNNSNPIQVSAVNGLLSNVGSSIAGVYGSLTLNANGGYTYVANNAENLAAGVTAADVFTYTISNGLGGTDTATLTINLTGTNDVPVFSGTSTGGVTEDVAVSAGNLTASGTLIVTDVDAGQSAINAAVQPVSVGYNLGSLTINAAGVWTYTVANDAVQYLGSGETRNEVFTVTTVDGTTRNITVSINGAQDNPSAQNSIVPIPKSTTHVLTADDFDIVDADANDALMITITATPGEGTLKYYNGTTWETVVPNKVIPYEAVKNGLLVYIPATGDTGNEAFSYTVSDGVFTTPLATVTFSINIELSVSSPLPVDEGKATVFAVELSDDRTVDTLLTLALGGDVYGDDYVTPMQVRYLIVTLNPDGITYTYTYTAWQDVSGGQITLAAGITKAEVKVKTVVNDDGLDVVSEALTLTATTTAAADLANTSATGQTSINDLPSLLVSGASYVSEGGSTFFALELSAIKATGTLVTLSFEGVATPGALADYEYSLDGGTSWISLATTTVTIPGNTLSNPTLEILVRTRADAVVESDEVLRLVATTYDAGVANSNTEVTASTLIVDPIIVSTNEDTALTIGSTANFTVLGQGAHGTVSVVADNVVYTPAYNYHGPDSFTVTKTNEVGLSVTSVVNVTVVADADAPVIDVAVSDAQYNNDTTIVGQIVDNGTFTSDLSNWTLSTSVITASSDFYIRRDATSTSTMEMGAKKGTTFAEQVMETVSGRSYSVTMNLTGDISGFSATFGGTTVAPPAGWAVGVNTFTVTGGANAIANTLRFTVTAPTGQKNIVDIDNVSIMEAAQPGTYTYSVNVDGVLVDTDGSESLRNFIIRLTDGDGAGTAQSMPSGAVLRYSNGDLVPVVVAGSSWSVDPARASGLKLTITRPVLNTAFTLTAEGTTIEAFNSDVSSIGTDSVLVTALSTASNAANPVPTIADAVATLSNAQQTQNISTSFGDGTNKFSWVTVVDSLPKIYANGEVVQYSVKVSTDGQTGTITGTTSAGAVFTLSIVLGSPNAVATYTQFTSLQGTEVIASGANMLTSGNGSDLLLTFDAGGGTTFNAVVTGVNYLDGTSTTINTSSKYIGASNNLMNPGERVTMDFASGTTGNAVASMKISFFSFDSAAATAPDELTIYGTTVDGTQFTYQITNASLDASGMYTIRAPGNELIRELVFEAGSQSSFKLGIESVSAVNDVPTFTVPLVYEITDASGDSDTGTISVTLGGLSGTSGNDTLNGGVNSDVMSGDAGNDTLNGGAGNDMINGGIGDDVIIGGAGNDTLTGGLGSDVFRWSLADAGAAGSPAIDSITDFDTTAGTDKLDLRDLLSNEVYSATSLDNFLHFEVTGGNTIVHISSTGGFGDNNAVSVGSAGVSGATETQQIVLVGVDLSAGNLTTDQQIIQSLINNQKLITE